MKNARIEIIYLISVAIISLSFSIVVGFEYLHPEKAKLSWKDLKKARVTDIGSDFKETDDPKIRFHNGVPYASQTGSSGDVSSFYNENINLNPTSSYWRHPVNENKTRLIINKNNSVELSIEKMNGLPVISLIIEPDDFFSYEKGIYVPGYDSDFTSSTINFPFPWHKPANYYKKENDKRKVFFSYYDEKGKEKYSSFAMVEINGKATRCFPQKSLRLTASKETESKKFEFDFFGDGKFYNSMVLRNGGNDNAKSLIRDMLMQTLIRESGAMISGFVPCEVYLNGEYWGIHFIQNKLNENFIAQKMEVKEKKVNLVASWKLENGDEVEFNSIINLIKERKDFNYGKISEAIDMDDLTNYIAAELFFANSDWPANNFQMYQVAGSRVKENKWKFLLFDLDYGFGYTGADAYRLDMFAHLEGGNDLFSDLFKRLMKEKSFRKLLKEKLILLQREYCSEKRMLVAINDLKNELEGAIPDHTSRWRKPFSLEDWEQELEILKEFAERRNEVMNIQIKKYLN